MRRDKIALAILVIRLNINSYQIEHQSYQTEQQSKRMMQKCCKKKSKHTYTEEKSKNDDVSVTPSA